MSIVSIMRFSSFTSRLSRKIAFWVFACFMVIEGVVFIPSFTNEVNDQKAQLREVTAAKLQWILLTYPEPQPEDLLAHVAALQADPMLSTLLGASLYDSESGRSLGSFGDVPELSYEQIVANQGDRWFPLQQRYDASWLSPELNNNYVLIIRHNANSIQHNLILYALKILLAVMFISAMITVFTMLIVERIVLTAILDLRDRLIQSGKALTSQDMIEPEVYLMTTDRHDELGDVIAAFNQSFQRTFAEMARRKEAEQVAQTERAKAERLLLNILPAPIATELKQGHHNIASGFDQVTVLFADIVGFTSSSSRVPPVEVVKLLNQIFSHFDYLSEKYGLEKIKTIGDNYMVAGGLPTPNHNHAEAIARMALEMQKAIAHYQFPGENPLQLRIGINTGPVVAGVIGRRKFIYDLWGDAVNIASRMESHGLPGQIQVTQTTYERLNDQFEFAERGFIEVKGRGSMKTYWLLGQCQPLQMEKEDPTTGAIAS